MAYIVIGGMCSATCKQQLSMVVFFFCLQWGAGAQWEALLQERLTDIVSLLPPNVSKYQQIVIEVYQLGCTAPPPGVLGLPWLGAEP